MIGNVSLPNSLNSQNPFRKRFPNEMLGNISHTHTISKKVNALDPLSYKDEMIIRPVGHLNACVKPYVEIGGVPSRSEINDTLIKLARKTVLSYNARIVETGAALKVIMTY
jgi:hypothetical protein